MRLSPYHLCIKPTQTSPAPASESFSYKHQTCINLTHTGVWTLLIKASNLHKPHSLLRLNPFHTSIKPAQTSPTHASQPLSFVHQTCTNLTHTCVWILLIQASNLHKPHTHTCVWILLIQVSNLRKPHPLMRLNPYHLCIKPAQTSPTPASESFSYKPQTWINLTHACVWILLTQASNLHKPRPL